MNVYGVVRLFGTLHRAARAVKNKHWKYIHKNWEAFFELTCISYAWISYCTFIFILYSHYWIHRVRKRGLECICLLRRFVCRIIADFKIFPVLWLLQIPMPQLNHLLKGYMTSEFKRLERIIEYLGKVTLSSNPELRLNWRLRKKRRAIKKRE